MTTRVSAVLIDGKVVDLNNRQTELYHKYRERWLQKCAEK